MLKIRYASLDDEPFAHEVLRVLIQPHLDFVDHGAYLDAGSARDGLAQHPVDLLFLDIQLQTCTGLDFLAQYERPTFATVLVTAYAQYALEAFGLGVRDYLLKPMSGERLALCLERIRPLVDLGAPEPLRHVSGRLAFSTGRSHLLEAPGAIAAVDAYGNFSRLCRVPSTMGAEPNPLISESLKSLEIRLEPFGFLRCHKGHLVNLAHVIGLDAAGVHLSDGSSRPVGRAYRQTLLNALGMKLQ